MLMAGAGRGTSTGRDAAVVGEGPTDARARAGGPPPRPDSPKPCRASTAEGGGEYSSGLRKCSA
eukprot:10481319-Heterocapsa_arctica.AAC.1